MAGWSGSFAGANQQNSVPSLASIMQEQETEHEQRKVSSQHVGSSKSKFSAQWKPPPTANGPPRLSNIMDEQRLTPGTSRSDYTFKSPNKEKPKVEPYTKPERVTPFSSRDPHVTSSNRTSVVNVRKQSLKAFGYKDLVDWLKDPSHVYIGRNMTHYVPGAVGSKWGNPFKLAKGDTRGSSTERYRQYIKTDTKVQTNGKTLLQSLDELKGKTLGCWCHPELCHGHILVQLIEEHCG